MTITQQVQLYEVVDNELKELKTFVHQLPNDATEVFSESEMLKLMQVISSMPTKEQLKAEQGLDDDDADLVGKPTNNEEKEKWQFSLKTGMFKIMRRGAQEPVYQGEGFLNFQKHGSETAASATAEATVAPTPAIDKSVLEERQKKVQKLETIETELDDYLRRKQEVDEQINRLQTESQTIEEGMAKLAQDAKTIRDELAASEAAVDEAKKMLMQNMQLLQEQMRKMQEQAQMLGLSI